jgi:hypothetical protein
MIDYIRGLKKTTLPSIIMRFNLTRKKLCCLQVQLYIEVYKSIVQVGWNDLSIWTVPQTHQQCACWKLRKPCWNEVVKDAMATNTWRQTVWEQNRKKLKRECHWSNVRYSQWSNKHDIVCLELWGFSLFLISFSYLHSDFQLTCDVPKRVKITKEERNYQRIFYFL